MKKDPGLKVTVVERDKTYSKASTVLSMVNCCIQFSLKKNIEISQYAFTVLENLEEEMEVNGVKKRVYSRYATK